MTLWDRVRGIRKRWWILAGIPTLLVLVASTWLLVKWAQYRHYQQVSLVSILPDDAQAAARIEGLARRWPALSKAPALIALARAKNPSRGDAPLTVRELAGLLGGELPPEASDERILQLAGKDAAAAVLFENGKQDVVAATRVPFMVFLAAPFIKRAAAPAVAIEFRGDIMIAGTRADWVATAARRAETGERGRIALELDAASPDGDPAFWVDVAAARHDPVTGPKLKEWFNSVPVREALFMVDLEAVRALSGRFVAEGSQARLEGTIWLASKLGDRLAKMYAMKGGDSPVAALIPANACYATGGRFDATTTWDFFKDLTKPAKGSARRATSQGFGDFVDSLYIYLHEGVQSAEEHKSDKAFRDMFNRDAMLVLTTESQEPFLGLTILARIDDGPKAMELLFQFFKWLHEEDTGFSIESDTYRGLDVRLLKGRYDAIGAGVYPAFAITDGILILSSSVETLKAIADVKLGGAPGFAGSPTGLALRSAAPADGPAWAYANMTSLRGTLTRTKSFTAKSQVERQKEAKGAAKIRTKVAEEFRRVWEEAHPGQPWVAAEHVTEIDDAFRRWEAEEQARIEREVEELAGRLNRIAGMAFTVKAGEGDTLTWVGVLQAEAERP